MKLYSKYLKELKAQKCIQDILIWDSTIEEHHYRLKKALDRAIIIGLKLNKRKCIFKLRQITYLGERLTEQVVCIDPRRTQAITNMPHTENKEGVQRFIGKVNLVGKFISKLAAQTSNHRVLS